MSNKPKISFIIPTYNSASYLEDCLISIKKQNYPKDKLEIITPDGGSIDKSKHIAQKYGCKVIKNLKILAEPGFMLGASQAKGELIVYMGADNRLSDKEWINNMIKPFKNYKIIGAYPWHKNDSKNTWLTKYFNAFTDPINHFVLGYAANPRYFNKVYKTLIKNKDFIVYDFSLNNYPMLALDQGFMLRKTYKRRKDTEYDDILPVLDMIKERKLLAFVPNASNYHFTLEKGLPQFFKKMRWALDNNICPNRNAIGFIKRKENTNLKRKILLYIWPIYAVTIIGPIISTVVGLVRDREIAWIYHLPITSLMVILVFWEIVRLKVLKQKSLASRQ